MSVPIPFGPRRHRSVVQREHALVRGEHTGRVPVGGKLPSEHSALI